MGETGHFLRICDFSSGRLEAVVGRGIELKKAGRGISGQRPLDGMVMTMLFSKPSTRTRVSFEAGMAQLGGSAVYLDAATAQLSRGESVSDTARSVSPMCDVAVIRAHDHSMVEEFAAASSAPVVNALTDVEHPCQILADVMTFTEHRGEIKGRKVAWVGDCNNVCRSWMGAAGRFGFDLRVASPADYHPDGEGCENVTLTEDPKEAAEGAACVVTDVWCSMGDDGDRQKRLDDFSGYAVDAELMGLAADDALFMHCLPAHRGEEVAAEVIDGPQSVVWDEAENRLHVQKALLVDMLSRRGP